MTTMFLNPLHPFAAVFIAIFFFSVPPVRTFLFVRSLSYLFLVPLFQPTASIPPKIEHKTGPWFFFFLSPIPARGIFDFLLSTFILLFFPPLYTSPSDSQDCLIPSPSPCFLRPWASTRGRAIGAFHQQAFLPIET